MRTSIAARIRRALIGLALGLSVVFAALTLLLLYVTEDRIFMNQLAEERSAIEDAPAQALDAWQPPARHMRLYLDRAALPGRLRQAVGDEPGIYEQFDAREASFVLVGVHPESARTYYLVYDVAGLLAVREGRAVFVLAVALGALLVIAIAVVVAIYLARTTLRPLRRLSARLSRGGELPQDFAARFAGDEVGVLATALESALDRVRASAQREFEFNRGVSHELRSPIQVASNALELLTLAPSAADPGLAGPIGRLTRALREMEGITEAFLWLASEREYTGEPVGAAAVAATLIDDLRQQWPGREIGVDTPQGEVFYDMPESVFAVVLGNLLRNALRHSDAGGVRCELLPHRIVVEDDGSRGARPDDRAGFGVGLQIVERICERFGWRLALTPSEVGMRARADVPPARPNRDDRGQ